MILSMKMAGGRCWTGCLKNDRYYSKVALDLDGFVI